MPLRRLLNVLVLLAAAATTLPGCAPLPLSNGVILDTKDELLLLAALTASADAWNRGDLKGHLAIYDQSVTVMTKDGPRPTVEAIERSFSQAYFSAGRPNQNLAMTSVVVRALSEQSALMTGRFSLSGGSLPEQSGWFTLIWVRTSAGWRAVHDHTS